MIDLPYIFRRKTFQTIFEKHASTLGFADIPNENLSKKLGELDYNKDIILTDFINSIKSFFSEGPKGAQFIVFGGFEQLSQINEKIKPDVGKIQLFVIHKTDKYSSQIDFNSNIHQYELFMVISSINKITFSNFEFKKNYYFVSFFS